MSKFKKKIKIGVVVGLEREKKLLKNFSNLTVSKGYGKNAAKAAKEVLSRKVDIIFSLGYAGSLSEKLTNGQIVLPKRIFTENGSCKKTSKKFSIFFLKNIQKMEIKRHDLLTVKNVINCKEKKKKLFFKYQGVSVIDMESAIVQKIAINQKVPFISARVIFDDTTFSIPNFLTDCIDKQGNIIIGMLMRNLIKKPSRISCLFTQLIKYNKAKMELKKLCKNLFSKI